MLSYDIFNYLATAKVTYFYGENPYLVMPIEFVSDPMLLFTRAANKYALYGPTWILLTGIPFALSFGNVLTQIFLFKALTAAFYVGTVYLLYKLSSRPSTVVFFALNPLVLIETFISGHNDIVMVFFVLLGFLLLKNNKNTYSIISLCVSIFIKFASIALIPVWIYVIYKNKHKEMVQWDKIWIISLLLLSVVFLLSPIREEMYPWYFIWLIPFVGLAKNKKLSLGAASLSAGFLFYYVPYMYTGYYLLGFKMIFVLLASVCVYFTCRLLPPLKNKIF